ncbi:PQQ-binding-like beta-propeller repeat protein [uncultured Dokdonia sp.]|uniref:outer membrane protein assembly factor BamB family protein n=1 Tax=unclassified Dokdonia TaxID=2615033 RepID=UPI002612C201|nr:PQQ-binding-like beta-propeller repeat protein [uncultured Dokdonia sp.]
MKKLLLVTFGLIMSIHTVSAQDKLWEKNLKEELYNVSWIKQSNDGVIIAAGDKGLLALNNVTGETLWHNKELKAVDKNTFFAIEGLPIIYVEYTPILGNIRGLLLNSSTGDILFDTKDEGYKIRNFTTIPEKEAIFFELLDGPERYFMSFSLKTWKSQWVTALGKSKNLLKKFTRISIIDKGPFFNKEGNIIISIKDEIFTIDAVTGEMLWQYKGDKKINALVYSDVNNSLYVGIRKSKRLIVLNPSTGEDITPGKLKLRGTLIDVRQDNGNLILVETEGFNIIDPKTNEFTWKKSFKIEFLDEVIPNEQGYIAIGKDEDDGTIALVDREGDKIWNSKVKGYAYYVTPTKKGVLYVSTERSNILDFEDGKDVWKRDVKFRTIPAVTYDNQEDKVVLFENGNGYKFDLTTGDINLFAEDIDLEAVKRKTPLVAEYVPGAGYLLQTDQHMSLLEPSGNLKYTDYYTPPSSLGGFVGLAQLGLNIAGVDLDIQGSMENISMLSSLSNGAYRTRGDQSDVTSNTDSVVGLYIGDENSVDGDLSTYYKVFEITKTRYFNSKSIDSHKFIVAKIKKETGSQHYIYMINKATGKRDKQIELLDKTPNYFIDEVDNVVFVNEKNRVISAYQF